MRSVAILQEYFSTQWGEKSAPAQRVSTEMTKNDQHALKPLMKKLFTFMLLALFTQSLAADTKDDQHRLDEVRDEINAISAELSEKKADKDKLYKQLKQQSKTISKLNKQQRDLADQILQKKKESHQIQQKLGIKQQEQEQQLDGLYDQIRSAYIHAQPSYLQILLSQQDISSLSRTTTYYHYFHQARQQELEQINDTLLNLNTQQQTLLKVQASLEALYEQQKTQQVALKAESDKRAKTLKQLEQHISTKGAKLASLKAEEQALRDLLAKLSKHSQQQSDNQPYVAAQPGQAFSGLNGKLPWPIRGKVLARYGSTRNLGKLKWQGIVISASTGQDIHASAAGKVVFSDWLRGFGLLIIIDHGEQYMTLYGNNDALLKDVGDEVLAGEVISQSGKEDIRGLAGLYFEIRHKGSPTNPLKWLQRKG